MFPHIILLTPEVFKAPLFTMLGIFCEGVRYHFAFDRPMFEEALRHADHGTFLLSIGTGVIVRKEELEVCGLCINVHPATPEYPGLYPHVFAYHNHAQEFGVTAHIMTPRVDDGPILTAKRFPVDPKWSEDDLLSHSIDHSFLVIENLLETIFVKGVIPQPLSIPWSKTLCTRATYDALRAQQGSN